MSYVPLKITFKMKTPIALGFPWIFFDSLILHILVKEELGEKYYTLPSKAPVKLDVEPPLKKYHDIYVASVGVFDGEPRVFNYFKRADLVFPRGKIRRGSGFFKDFYLKIVYIPVKEVTFYATGEYDEVKRLVSKITALGKDRNIGFGFVKEAVVEEVDYEAGLVWNNRCMRPIPVKYLRDYEDAAYLAYKPPYWSKYNIDLCGVPFTKCTLK